MKGEIFILGGGISGLTSAWYLSQKYQDQCRITLLEQSSSFGGWIKTKKREPFLFDLGPRGFYGEGKGRATLELVSDLRLEDQLITSIAANRRYLLLDGYLRRLTIPLLIKKGLLRALFKGGIDEDEEISIDAFFTHHMGKTFAKQIADPMARGIFAGSAQNLSMKACMPKLMGRNPLLPFLFSPKKSFYSFKEGMESLIVRLVELLHDKVDLKLEHKVLKLKSKGKKVIIECDHDQFVADHVISCLPAFALQSMLEVPCPFLSGIDYQSLWLIHVGYVGDLLKKRGFGFLTLSEESDDFLGMSWDSALFPSMRGSKNTQLTLLFLKPASKHWAQEIVSRYLQIEKEPDFYEMSSAPQCIPQYLLGHLARFENRNVLPNLHLGGNLIDGIGINDCIERSRRMAYSLPLPMPVPLPD